MAQPPHIGPIPIPPEAQPAPSGVFTNFSDATRPAVSALNSQAQADAASAAVEADGGFGIGVSATSAAVAAVHGVSARFDGVVGETNSDVHAGVTGRNLTKGANGGVGIYGTGGKYAGKFDGDVQINGTVNVAVDITLANQDCAEDFDVALCVDIEPGTVMVLDECGLLQESRRAYDRKVAGVISGAGEFKPGLILGRDKGHRDGHRAPVALVGKVYCKVDAQHAPIEIGDLLTTSTVNGHAMRAEDPMKAFGAVIGKALQSMPAGQKGLIPILVALQ